MGGNNDTNVFNEFIIRILEDPNFAEDVTQPENAVARKNALNAFLDDMENQSGKQFRPEERDQAIEDLIQVLSTTDLDEMRRLRETLTGEVSAEIAL